MGENFSSGGRLLFRNRRCLRFRYVFIVEITLIHTRESIILFMRYYIRGIENISGKHDQHQAMKELNSSLVCCARAKRK